MTLAISPPFVLDANVFIEASKNHYGLELCPGFWKCLDHFGHAKQVMSIDKVKAEIRYPEALVAWTRNLPEGFFVSTDKWQVEEAFGAMADWVEDNEQFLPRAKTEFLRVADGWLASYTQARGATLVTHEKFDSVVKRRVPLPNICQEFNVSYADSFTMLRYLGVRFDWVPSRAS